jgi:PKD repeat protein
MSPASLPRLDVQVAAPATILFASDETWGGQRICISSVPIWPCPSGVTSWGYPYAGAWPAGLSAIPGASWVWTAGLNGYSVPAYPATASFTKSFNVPGSPTAAAILIAADDSAAIFVNGSQAGSVGGTVAGAPDAKDFLRSFNITPYLHAGTNTITVQGFNGDFGCRTGPFWCNPAGVVFGGSITYTPNSAPTISMSATYSEVEGLAIEIDDIIVGDADGDDLSYIVEFGDTPAPVASPTSISGTVEGTDAGGGVPLSAAALAHAYGDNGSYTLVVTVTEIGKTPALSATANATITVANRAPQLTHFVLPAAPIAVGTSMNVVAGFSDDGWRDTHTLLFMWDWDAAAAVSAGSELACPALTCVIESPVFNLSTGVVSSGAASGSYTYVTPGVYTVRATVTDDDGASAEHISTADVPSYVVVYDPTAGFVTGSGWIESPAGACRYSGCSPDGSTIGKASFGFVSRYAKGASIPTGNTQFHFQAGALKFHSSAYQWLVIAGARAQFKGEGTINGAGRFGFLLTAIDGDVAGGDGSDRFRIKIWDIGSDALPIIYDNQMSELDDSSKATSLGGGSISIKAK